MACRCDCCKGACCYEFAGEPTCSFQSCADCEELGGKFQGPGTECTGEDSNVCPCDPPADHLQCEKCASGAPADRCQEGQYCCDGVCQDEPCPAECDPPCDPDLCEECIGGECMSICGEGEACCQNQNGVTGCWPFPGRCGDDWCSNCGSAGGIETRIGPYATRNEALSAAQAECDSNSCDGVCSIGDEECGSQWYGFICCTPDVP